MADPDAPAEKRARLDSASAYNGHNGHAYPPPPPPHAQSIRPLSHPPLVQASSPPPSRHYPHGLPPPYPGQASYPGQHPSPSLPPTDIRSLADPRNIPSPGQRSHGVAVHSPVTIAQDRISTYRPAHTPQSTSAPDGHSSRSTSLSNSVDVKSQPPSSMEHSHHQSQWPINAEQRPNGLSNGYHHAISPPHTNGPAFQPPPPPPGQQYAQAVATPYPQTPYMADYGTAAQQMRRKQVRATQACNHCRSRKQKCDEARPCQFCRENNFDCQYKDVPPPKQDRSMMQLQDSMNTMSDGMKTMSDFMKNFVHEFRTWKEDVSTWKESVETRLGPGRSLEMTANDAPPDAAFAAPMRDQSTSRFPTSIQVRGHGRRASSSLKVESPIVPHSNIISPMSAQASTPIKPEPTFALPHQPATPADSVRTDHSRTTAKASKEKDKEKEKENHGLQGDHTTPAHQLLEAWQSMKPFYKDVPYLRRLEDDGHAISDYPMQLEQDRGILRVWGVGEGQDLNDGAQGPGSPESSNNSDATSPAPGKDGLWGHSQFLDQSSPRSDPAGTPREYHGRESGLGADGRPDFSCKVLDEGLESYMSSIHNFHPFMNEGKLRRMFKQFSAQYSPDPRSGSTRSPAATGLPHNFHPGVKRKRSNSAVDGLQSPRGEIERSLRNAIVLLVLALGKVCAHTKPLPAPQSDKSQYVSGSWGSRGSANAPGSFNSDASDDHRPRNIDVLPGMAYYAYATDILGNQQGGNTVAHAQAMLLAALYLSQFARVLESWSWINNACRVVLVLIKADYSKLKREEINFINRANWTPKERYRLNLVMCAYWTALQLESDILAEMSALPPSGISAHQNVIMYPDGVNVDNWDTGESSDFSQQEVSRYGGQADLTMHYYSTQIWLRVVLNEAHNALYGHNGRVSFDTTNVKEVAKYARHHSDILENWRALLPSGMAWQDDDPPATDINIARYRAKYYGGLYMMLRPYLRLASQMEFPPSITAAAGYQSQHNSPTAYGNSSSTPTSRNVQMVDLNEDQQNMLRICAQCIDSAMRSTIAFDRVGADPDSPYTYFEVSRPKRLVVTNIFGTLHAQWGNMLVLAAVYSSKLYPLLQSETWLNHTNLNALFKRTIGLLEEVAPNSPILNIDLQVLRGAQSCLAHK
ncbi:hypothetical protein EJ02DRAFT_168438 [Clathrospora elynae]|uniref:Zn(2)-C6 fungal-type domain-containing protein n=1 Tax=Clathrospora elynae TaxID=706981 RepID=A0A6A5SV20_9PLEO|nr:hypothetical protein EJ02DRAFT_168438 [Clathrospora elynae]